MLRKAQFLLKRVNISNIYDKDVKLSVKVYNLQEYAKYRQNTPIATYDNHNDYKLLISEVDKGIKDLSPAQLLATAIAYTRLGHSGRIEWRRLCSAACRLAYKPQSNITGMSSSEVAMILYSYAKMYTFQLPVTYRLLRWVVRNIGILNERDISMILYYMRRTNCIPIDINNTEHFTYAKILRSIVLGLSNQGGNKLHKYTPRSLVSIVYDFSNIGMIPWSFVYHSCNLIRKSTRKLDFKSIALHSKSLSLLKLKDSKTLESFANILDATTEALPTATITCILYSLAKLKYRPKTSIEQILLQVQKRIFSFSDADVAQIAYSLGQLGYRDLGLFNSINSFITSRIEYQPPQHLVMFIQSYGRLGIYERSVADLVIKQSLELLNGFTASQLIALMDGCVLIDHFNEHTFTTLLSKFLSFTIDELPDHLINQLNRIMYCLRLEHPEFVEKSNFTIKNFINQFQASFINKTSNSSYFYETLHQLGISFTENYKVGLYNVDILLPNNTTLELLSQGSVCPLTGSILGSSMLQKRHLELLGYKHVQLNKREWIKKNYLERQNTILNV